MAGRLEPSGSVALTPQQQNYKAIKAYVKTSQEQFTRMLGTPEKASQFGASVISAVATNPKLQECNPAQVMQCALIAASLNLDVNSNLGMSAIVPYKAMGVQVPQFQIMVRGWIQLAMRSGEYTALDCIEVYKDEFISFDPFLNKLNYKLVPNGDRDNGKYNNIVGYYAYFKLINGAEHCLYWTKKQIEEHAKKFSKAYAYDLANKKQSSPWSTNFDAMAKKTLIKALLSKWGMLSTIMSKAVQLDQATNVQTDGNDNLISVEYADAPNSLNNSDSSDSSDTTETENVAELQNTEKAEQPEKLFEEDNQEERL